METPRKSKVVAVVNKKGGAGKSTTTINLAAAAHMAGIRTGIIDIDADQQAAAKWSDARADRFPLVKSGVHTRLPQTIAELEKEGVELIFIDGPALVEAPTKAAMKEADFVLVPCRTTPNDLQYLAQTMEIAADVEKPTAVVLNSIEENVKDFEEAKTWVSGRGYALSPVHLSKSVFQYRPHVAGLGVTEFAPAEKAAHEVLSLLEWISRLIYLETDITMDILKPQRRSRTA